jgi:Zn-finger nucleic acid-binding protein
MNEDEAVKALQEMQLSGVQDNEKLRPRGSRPCPICGRNMQTEPMQGVNVDVCPDHGIWLDNGELSSILASATSSEAIRSMNAIRDAKRQGKVSGALFGVWSLLGD